MKKIMFFALIATLLGVVSCQKEFFPTESIVENTKTPDLDPETAKIIGYWTCKATVAENGNTVEYDILFNADGTYYLHLLETRIDGTEHTPTIHLGKFYLEGGKIHFDDCIGIHNTCLNYFFDGDFLVIESIAFNRIRYVCKLRPMLGIAISLNTAQGYKNRSLKIIERKLENNRRCLRQDCNLPCSTLVKSPVTNEGNTLGDGY